MLSLVGCGMGDAANDMENDMNNLEEGLENEGIIDQNGNMAQGDKNNAGTGENGMNMATTRYSENDIEFDVPQSWQNNFLAKYDDVADSAGNAYSTIDFYYSTAETPYKIMTIARFPKDSWAAITQSNAEAEKKKLGESKDGEWIYSLNYEADELSNDEGYLAVKKDVEELKDKIKITK